LYDLNLGDNILLKFYKEDDSSLCKSDFSKKVIRKDGDSMGFSFLKQEQKDYNLSVGDSLSLIFYKKNKRGSE